MIHTFKWEDIESSIQQNKIEYICMDASEKYIVLGANTGSLYFYRREPLNYLRLFTPPYPSKIELVVFSPDQTMIALSTNQGLVYVYKHNLESNENPKILQKITEIKGTNVTSIVWNENKQIFFGNNKGFVHGCDIEKSFLSVNTIASISNSSIIQLDIKNNKILISSSTTAAIYDLTTREIKQIGKKRSGAYGLKKKKKIFFNFFKKICFLKTIGGCFHEGLGNYFLVSRSGMAIWLVKTDNPEKQEMILSYKTSRAQTPPVEILPLNHQPLLDQIQIGFSKLIPFQNILISFGSGNPLFFIDMQNIELIDWHKDIAPVNSISVVGETIYLCHGENKKRFSKIVIKKENPFKIISSLTDKKEWQLAALKVLKYKVSSNDCYSLMKDIFENCKKLGVLEEDQINSFEKLLSISMNSTKESKNVNKDLLIIPQVEEKPKQSETSTIETKPENLEAVITKVESEKEEIKNETEKDSPEKKIIVNKTPEKRDTVEDTQISGDFIVATENVPVLITKKKKKKNYVNLGDEINIFEDSDVKKTKKTSKKKKPGKRTKEKTSNVLELEKSSEENNSPKTEQSKEKETPKSIEQTIFENSPTIPSNNKEQNEKLPNNQPVEQGDTNLNKNDTSQAPKNSNPLTSKPSFLESFSKDFKPIKNSDILDTFKKMENFVFKGFENMIQMVEQKKPVKNRSDISINFTNEPPRDKRVNNNNDNLPNNPQETQNKPSESVKRLYDEIVERENSSSVNPIQNYHYDPESLVLLKSIFSQIENEEQENTIFFPQNWKGKFICSYLEYMLIFEEENSQWKEENCIEICEKYLHELVSSSSLERLYFVCNVLQLKKSIMVIHQFEKKLFEEYQERSRTISRSTENIIFSSPFHEIVNGIESISQFIERKDWKNCYHLVNSNKNLGLTLSYLPTLFKVFDHEKLFTFVLQKYPFVQPENVFDAVEMSFENTSHLVLDSFVNYLVSLLKLKLVKKDIKSINRISKMLLEVCLSKQDKKTINQENLFIETDAFNTQSISNIKFDKQHLSSFLCEKENTKIPKVGSFQLEWKYENVFAKIIKNSKKYYLDPHFLLSRFSETGYHKGLFKVYSSLLKRDSPEKIDNYLHSIKLLLYTNSIELLQDLLKNQTNLDVWRFLLYKLYQIVVSKKIQVEIEKVVLLVVNFLQYEKTLDLLDEVPDLLNHFNFSEVFSYVLRASDLEIEKMVLEHQILETIDTNLWTQKPMSLAPQIERVFEYEIQKKQENLKSFANNDSLKFDYLHPIPCYYDISVNSHWGITLPSTLDAMKCQVCDFLLPQEVNLGFGSNIIIFDCSHTFHQNCVSEDACPLCYYSNVSNTSLIPTDLLKSSQY